MASKERMAMKTTERLAIVLLLFTVQSVAASGQTVTFLYSFSGSDGSEPLGGLTQGTDGNFYGMTTSSGEYPLGTVFRISPSGDFTNLHSFLGYPVDGQTPYGSLVQGNDGDFYGTTLRGGVAASYCNCGTLFRISPSGDFTNLHSFSGYPVDGSSPYSGLVQGSDSNFYGTTGSGGLYNWGTVFRITPSGTFTVIHSFVYATDSASPRAALVQGSDGSFYGTAFGYGTGVGKYGCVFRVSPSGDFTNLHMFTGFSSGALPLHRLVPGSDGNFYGSTSAGGANGNGTFFRISPSGVYTDLYSFVTGGSDLIQGSDGNFYGMTGVGEETAIFDVSPSGSYTNLALFNVAPKGGPVSQGIDGNFYGMTYFGGASNYGTVYEITIPLNPPANQISAIQSSANNLVFNIPSVAGETYQLQFTTDPTSGIWSNAPGVSVTNSIGALLTLTNFGGASGPQGFYRFDITP
jgi:uncharacterized repeat protein (TIGR03803 family)